MDDNTSKNLRGKKAHETLDSVLENFLEKGYISNIETKYRAGYKGMKEQFYFAYLIEFTDGEKWILQSTTTFPRDRVGIYHWNAQHLKKLDAKISCAYVVYPEGASPKEIDSMKKYDRNIQEEKIISSIEGIISLGRLYDLIEEKALGHLNVGTRKARLGTDFEKRLVRILTDKSNWRRWNGDETFEFGLFYNCFTDLMVGFGINKSKVIEKIYATSNIRNLPPSGGKTRGGKPKTDVYVEITFEDGKKVTHTISSKRTDSAWVSGHEYSADKFIEVLGIQEQSLKNAIHEFQNVGGIKALSQESREAFFTYMPKYNEALAKWVYAGIGGDGLPELQWADTITVYKNDSEQFSVYPVEEYIDAVLNHSGGHLGTPFQWTIASGKLGKSIQLKSKVL